MNNQFLQHLKSITPQGRAEDTKIFIPADRFQDGNSDTAPNAQSAGKKVNLNEATLKRALMRGDKVSRQKASYRQSRLNAQRTGADADGGRVMTSGELAMLAGLNYKHFAPGSYTKKLDRTTAARRKEEQEKNSWNRDEVNARKQRKKRIRMALAAIGKKSPRTVKEAVSDPRGDPNRGGPGRAKPKLPPGQDPYDMYSKGEIRPYGGKLQKRLRSMSAEDRKRYYETIGIRSRAASRGGKTRRLFPVTEAASAKKPLALVKKAKRGLKKIGKKIGRALSTPQSGTDFEITGRKF